MSEHHPPSNNDVLSYDCDLAEPPQKVWRALTEPALVERWLMPDAAREDGPRPAFKGDGGRLNCTLVDAEPGRRVSYSWREGALDSIVTFSIAETAVGGTRLKIVHSAAAPALAMSAITGCRLSFAGPATPRPAANDPLQPMLRLAA